MNRQLLNILRCPVTKQKLHLLSDERLKKLQQMINDQQIKTQDDSVITQTPQAALISENENRIYLVVDDIPIMLEEKCVLNSHKLI